MKRKFPVRFGAGEKPEITSKAYLWLSRIYKGEAMKTILLHGSFILRTCDYL
ncbi:MAG TPA: hypothetical protein VIO64_02810 [Pseudobacteroides sp.]|uniref:hypothetical protein n=1 Tax=Pseudobacteroides sp. TaxID=1968840 RepID=UPI002F923BE1